MAGYDARTPDGRDQACGTGPFRPLAVVQTTGLATDGRLHLAFDPVLNSPESVRPQPEWLRRLRLSAYRYSRTGRPDITVDAYDRRISETLGVSAFEVRAQGQEA